MANRLNVQNIYASDSDTTAALTISSTDGISAPGLVGMIAAFAMSTAPSGWLVCNGAEYAIADYGDLYTAISTTWGSLTDGSGGAGSTHFVVPDLRGEFLRGWANGSPNDPDRDTRTGGDTVGSSQSNANASHSHSFNYYDWGASNYNGTATNLGFGEAQNYTGGAQLLIYFGDGVGYSEPGHTSQKPTVIIGGSEQDAINPKVSVADAGGDETRPRNKYVQYCIKF